MTPTPEQAKAELERRKENRKRKAAGEPTVPAADPEASKLVGAELRKIAESK